MQYIPVRPPMDTHMTFSDRSSIQGDDQPFWWKILSLQVATPIPIMLMANQTLLPINDKLHTQGLIQRVFYLENEDSSLISRNLTFRMSQKAQTIWESLDSDKHGLDKISETAWGFYSCRMLSDPELFVLRLHNDGQRKLKVWSSNSYLLGMTAEVFDKSRWKC